MSELELSKTWSLIIAVEEYIYNKGTGLEADKYQWMYHEVKKLRRMLESLEREKRSVLFHES